jgi:hypothetical protein
VIFSNDLFNREAHMDKLLSRRDPSVSLFDGDTNFGIRKERARAAIHKNNLADERVSKRQTDSTFATVFESTYSEKL